MWAMALEKTQHLRKTTSGGGGRLVSGGTGVCGETPPLSQCHDQGKTIPSLLRHLYV